MDKSDNFTFNFYKEKFKQKGRLSLPYDFLKENCHLELS